MSGGRVATALVGCGYVAQAEHIPCLLMSTTCRLAGLVEPRESARRALSARLDVPGYASLEELVAAVPQVQAVDICANALAHTALVDGALRLGLHVLVEKPLCHSVSEARALAAAAAAQDRRLMVGYMRRYDSAVLAAKRLLEEGRIGRLVSLSTTFKLALRPSFQRLVEPETAPVPPAARAAAPADLLPSDQVINQSLHHLNLIRFIGGEIRAVAGVRKVGGGVQILFDLEDGVVAHHAHVGNAGHGEELQLFGEAGMIHVRLWSPHIPYTFAEVTVFERAKAEAARVMVPVNNPYQAEIDAFGALVRGAGEERCPAADAVRDLEVIETIHAAAAEAWAVPVAHR